MASRSIPVRLKRKAPGESVERFRRREALEGAEPLGIALESLATYNIDRLAVARPALPDALGDRAADSWEPLLAIADLAGGEWPERARTAALALSAQGIRDDESAGVRLLADVRAAFAERDRLSTKEVLDTLAEDEEAPWATWHKGACMTPRALARLLERFGIRSRTVRFDDATTAKGYLREQFEDAWKRYLPAHPPDLSVTTSQPASLQGKPAFPIRHTTPLVTDSEEAANPHEQSDVTDVTDTNGGYGRLSASEQAIARDRVARARLEREDAEQAAADANEAEKWQQELEWR